MNSVTDFEALKKLPVKIKCREKAANRKYLRSLIRKAKFKRNLLGYLKEVKPYENLLEPDIWRYPDVSTVW